jgi:hypothetical protein
VAGCTHRCEQLLAVLLVTRRDDELDLGLERTRRAPLAVVIDRHDVAATARNEIENARSLQVGPNQRSRTARSGLPASDRAAAPR